jgi:hypothetical protein
MTKREQNKADKRIDNAYRKRCQGIQIDMMAIPALFAEGRKAIEEGVDDQVLGDRVAAFVETIRS